MITADVATNLLASALWELLFMPLFRGSRPVLGSARTLDTEIRQAIHDAARHIAEADRGRTIPKEAWEEFFESLEVQELIGHLFVFRASDEVDVGDIQAAFVGAWANFTSAKGIQDERVDAMGLWRRICEASDQVLDAAIHEGRLAGHEAKSAARHKEIAERLRAIERRQSPSEASFDSQALQRFGDDLRSEVGSRHAKIEPPSIQGRERVELKDLYVEPILTLREGDRDLSFTDFAGSLYRRVVLGAPGGGKSTLTYKMCDYLAREYSSCSVAGEPRIPFRVELRKYAATDVTGSLVDYFTRFAADDLALAVPDEGFPALLQGGRLLIILDGLDELLADSDRRDMRDKVESFCRQYPACPVLVTSRLRGYDDSPLDPAVFDTVRLEEFTERQVAEFAHKWFTREVGLTVGERDEMCRRFVDESAIAPDLRRNPLLLSLMCAYYRNTLSLPRNLPDIYGGCASLLFDNWDRSRGIQVQLPFREHVRPALNDLGHWLFTTPTLAQGVTYNEAVEHTTAFLKARRFGDEDRARAAAQEFIDFCRGRAWVFTDQGQSRTGEDLFGFTHRTFMEYFCADYLRRSSAHPALLVDALLERLLDPSWDVVARIALQMKARDLDDGADLIVRQMGYRAQALSLDERAAVLRIAVDLLSALVPNPETAKQLVEAVVVTLIKYHARAMGDEFSGLVLLGDEHVLDPGQKLLASLAKVDPDFRDVLVDALAATLMRHLRQAGPGLRRTIGDVLVLCGRWSNEGKEDFWADVMARIENRYSNVLTEASRGDVTFAVQVKGATRGVLDPADIVSWHGPTSLFVGRTRGLAGTELHSQRDEFMRGAFGGTSGAAGLDDLYALIRDAPRPWAGASASLSGRNAFEYFPAAGPADGQITGREYFVLWAMEAVAVETMLARRPRDGYQQRTLRALMEVETLTPVAAMVGLLARRGGSAGNHTVDSGAPRVIVGERRAVFRLGAAVLTRACWSG